jgi:hypothetical protein
MHTEKDEVSDSSDVDDAEWQEINRIMRGGLANPPRHLSKSSMTKSSHWLSGIAQKLQESAQQEATRLYQTIADLEQRKTEAEVAVIAARETTKRLDQFEPVIAGKEQCPVCWGHNAMHSDLTPIEIDLNAPDIKRFRCNTCQSIFLREINPAAT